MTPQPIGIATATGPMPGIFNLPSNGVIHVETFGSVSGVSATLQVQGTISGTNWASVGSAITQTGTTPTFTVASTAGAINFTRYRINVTALSGGSVTAYVGA